VWREIRFCRYCSGMTDQIPSEPPAEAQPTEPFVPRTPVTLAQPQTPPGWYPDAASGQKRWWNGTAWSDAYQPVTSGRGTAALALGIIGLVLAFIPALSWVGLGLGLIAVILGSIGLRVPLAKSRSFGGLILGAIAIVLAIVFGSVYAAVVFSGTNTGQSSSAQVSQPKQQPDSSAAAEPSTPATPAAPALTVAEQQAIISAKSYLSDGQGFSYQGLIDQLDSQYGGGFSVADATFAVTYLAPDFNAQAVIAAKGYVADGQGFSHDALVQQLSSPYGGNFTLAQAQYAVAQVGL
jgi:hypothetical protein